MTTHEGTIGVRRRLAGLLATVTPLVVAAASPQAVAAESSDGGRHHLRAVVTFEVANPADGTVLRGHFYLPDTLPDHLLGTVLRPDGPGPPRQGGGRRVPADAADRCMTCTAVPGEEAP